MDASTAARELGVTPGAPQEAVRAAYLAAARAAHPDLAPDGPARAAAEARFKRVAAAYAQLSAPGGGGAWAASDAASTASRAVRRPRAAFGNVAVALILSVPLAMAGVSAARARPGSSAAYGRPHGLLQPPVNEFLADAALPRVAPARFAGRWAAWGGWGTDGHSAGRTHRPPGGG